MLSIRCIVIIVEGSYIEPMTPRQVLHRLSVEKEYLAIIKLGIKTFMSISLFGWASIVDTDYHCLEYYSSLGK